MKKLIAFLCSLILCIILLVGVRIYFDKKIDNEYNDKVAEILTTDKFESIKLQKEGFEKEDNLLIFGSSELENSMNCSTHPISFFKNNRNGFQVNLIGRAGSQSLVHAIDIATIGTNLKNKKAVFILSPQWFNKVGIDESCFEANTSELQVYSLLFNNKINKKLKKTIASRIVKTCEKKPTKNTQIMKQYCRLYSKDDFVHKILLYSMTPYYWMRYELLSIKDDIKSDKLINSNNKINKNEILVKSKIDWDFQLKNAIEKAKEQSHNKFDMDDKSYQDITEKGLDKLKESISKEKFDESPEYGDFKLFLDICKEEGIKPLIVNIPVGGEFYDYCGHSISDRKNYYNEINKIVKSYGFEEADFSGHEYDKYFLKDGVHLGWKGWIYVNKAVDKYYHES